MTDVLQASAAAPSGRRKRERVDGVLLLDKPLGMSSTHALVAAKRLFNADKAGHGGTLDPLATGVLPLVFGEATKFAHDLLEADKTYVATLRLGVVTEGGDGEGRVISTAEVRCDAAQIESAVAGFRGDILQVPPMQSALKRDGKPLYELARAGITVERAPRPVTIHDIAVVDVALPDVTIRVTCSKGTYIRTLATDIGERLGCGATLVALRREAVGDLTLGSAVSLETLEQRSAAQRPGLLLPIDRLLQRLPRIDLDAAHAGRFLQGQRLRISPDVALQHTTGQNSGSPVRVYHGVRLLGVAQLCDGRLSPVRLVAAHPSSSPSSATTQSSEAVAPTVTASLQDPLHP